MKKNRIIKFRGKSDDEWVYGLLCKVNEGDTEHGELFEYKIQTDEKEYGEYNKYFITNKETIGQYTGLKDKNGKEIYEGDIIKAYDGRVQGEVIFDLRGLHFGIKMSENENYTFSQNFLNSKDVEVIGNIHDNPEMLKEV